MTAQEYRDALLHIAQIGKQLLAYMDEVLSNTNYYMYRAHKKDTLTVSFF